MRFRPAHALVVSLCLSSSAPPVLAAEDYLDRLDEALTFSSADASVRARLSGTLDLEGYLLQQPAPGLIYSMGRTLFNPRLSLFLDAQLGPHVYVFAQSRLDRGFDPSDWDARMRLDEYAIRFTPWEDGRFNLQVGKFATVVGNWNERHLSWENPFINAPLVYENVTAIYDSSAPESRADFVAGLPDAKYEYNPVIWGPSYATGASISGLIGKFDYAVEIKNAALSSRPKSWDGSDAGFSRPTVSARVGVRPNQFWRLGCSVSSGPYLRPEAEASLPPGRGLENYRENLIGQDISFQWHHWQLWAEFYEARFEVPGIGNADTFAYYLEAKYKFTPQCFAALRWNQQLFSTVPDGTGGRAAWGSDKWRLDLAVAYRFTPRTQLKLQYSIEEGDTGIRDYGHLFAVQFTVRF